MYARVRAFKPLCTIESDAKRLELFQKSTYDPFGSITGVCIRVYVNRVEFSMNIASEKAEKRAWMNLTQNI